MEHSDKVMSTAAALAALSSLACCLPPAIMAAVGFAGLGFVIAPLAPWMLGLSVGFLGIGLVQLYRSGRRCQKPSRVGLVMFSNEPFALTRRANGCCDKGERPT